MANKIGVVVIGRNEGERLLECLGSARTGDWPSVYVDSASKDASVASASSMGFDVLKIDESRPLSAGRARNEGCDYLMSRHPELAFVQFVDGDCEMAEGWYEAAERTLEEHPDVGVVCGRILERDAQRTIYRRLCRVEWQQPVGEVEGCGGIAMIRVTAFRQVGGYDNAVIAGEDRELCMRLRRFQWKVLRLDAAMAEHDCGMDSFGQWWRRSLRTGHCVAQGAALHGRMPERHRVRAYVSTWVWGACVPGLALGLAWPTAGLSLALLFAYPLQAWRVYLGLRGRGIGRLDRGLYAAFCLLGKIPQVIGLLLYHVNALTGQQTRLIEHKSVPKRRHSTAQPPTPKA